MNVSLSLTHACNLACCYCYAGRKRAQAMSSETARRALDFAFSLGDPQMQVGFFGGEPLLEWVRLCEATVRAEQLAAQSSVPLKKTVTTNATRLDEARARWLREHEFYVGISLDGNRAMHEATRPYADGRSSFDDALRGLDAAARCLPDYEVIVVIDPKNVRHLEAGVRFLADERGVGRVSVNPNFYTDWPAPALGEWETAFERLGDWYLDRYRAGRPTGLNFIDSKIITGLKNGYACGDRCRFGDGEIAVAPSGRLYPCERLIGDDTNDAVCIGDVFSGFDEIRRLGFLAARGNRDAQCGQCALRHRCMNWCGCINYTLTGAINHTGGAVCFHERLAIRVADRVGAALYGERNPAFIARFYGAGPG
ncbi:MAG: Anaerobic sulfatase-maturating enzyme [Lentisphaerae bacterium ADurb.BinA184]|nr:MAG: Anaerobic sulfatase-maturating enzyme [Lentisphaerae bacterium ADurb.BinA184]